MARLAHCPWRRPGLRYFHPERYARKPHRRRRGSGRRSVKSAARRRIGIYYRRRPENKHKKAGNIADFVTRWGGAYESMLVLDADSHMDGKTLITLARAMEADPKLGIIQTLPLLINR